MSVQLRRGFANAYAAFRSSPNTRVAPLIPIVLFGALTLVGMNDVTRRENNKSISYRVR